MNSEPISTDKRAVVFHVWPSLPHGLRMPLALALVAAGFAVQIMDAVGFSMLVSLPLSIALMLAGNLLLLVRGYDNRIEQPKFLPESGWQQVDATRMASVLDLHKRMKQWDASFLDITNKRGGVMFCMLVSVVLGLFVYGGAMFGDTAVILAVDLAVLFVPHFITGTRRILTQPELVVKISMIDGVLASIEKSMAQQQIDFFMLFGAKDDPRPRDTKFRIRFKDQKPEFLGLYGQVVVNTVQGSSYPYFYVVLVAKKEFGMNSKTSTFSAPKNMVAESKRQDDVDVLVIRQVTSKTSGYHTSVWVASDILKAGLALASRIAV